MSLPTFFILGFGWSQIEAHLNRFVNFSILYQLLKSNEFLLFSYVLFYNHFDKSTFHISTLEMSSFERFYCCQQAYFLKYFEANKILQQMLSSLFKIEELFAKLNGGAQFLAFKQEINKICRGGKIIDVSQIEKEQQMQFVLLLAMINRKSEKIKASEGNGEEQLMVPLEKNKAQIMKKAKCSQETIKAYFLSLKNAVNFVESIKQIMQKYKIEAYQTILALTDKEQSGFLWIKYAIQYSDQELNRFALQFNQAIQFIDYDQNKKQAKSKLFNNPKAINLLKAKQQYFYLYLMDTNTEPSPVLPPVLPPVLYPVLPPVLAPVLDKPTMKLISSGTLTTSRVSNIFNPKKEDNLDQSIKLINSSKPSSRIQPPENQNKHIEKLNQSGRQTDKLITQGSIRDSQVIEGAVGQRKSLEGSMIMATKVKCCMCKNSLSQVDCLSWNYLYYCINCVIDINVDTTDIPGPRINKFLRERSINVWDYKIQCPQCESMTNIKNYNPANKNAMYRCNMCRKNICVQHFGNIYQCFCYCHKCSMPTIYVEKLKINFCQSCRQRYCFKCNSKEKNNFCKCVCQYCLGVYAKTHECEPACHACNNKPPKLKTCRCGLFICYGCFYTALENYKQGANFPCNYSEYS